MTGPKLNEKSFVAGERSGTKASAKYVRSSASKARVVLNLIRGKDVRSADEILAFTDREMAVVVRKVLASAVQNAVNNDQLDADELYVKACFADEGPTLRRFAARARGRGTRINKRTCHITVVVARMDDDRLQIIQAKSDARGGATARRRARVEQSRQRAAAKKAEAAAPADQVEEQEEVTSVNDEVVEAEASEKSEEN